MNRFAMQKEQVIGTYFRKPRNIARIPIPPQIKLKAFQTEHSSAANTDINVPQTLFEYEEYE